MTGVEAQADILLTRLGRERSATDLTSGFATESQLSLLTQP